MFWLRNAVKMMFISAVASVVSVMVTWQIVHFYADKMVQTLFGEKNANFELTEFLSHLGEEIHIFKNGGTELPDSVAQKANPDPDRTGENPAEQQAGGTSVTEESPPTGTEEEETIPVFGNGGNRIVMSADEFFRKKNELNEEDKNKIFSLFFSQLSQEELLNLSAMAEDGITEEELQKIDEMAKKRLKPEEYEELLAIVKKYED